MNETQGHIPGDDGRYVVEYRAPNSSEAWRLAASFSTNAAAVVHAADVGAGGWDVRVTDYGPRTHAAPEGGADDGN